MYEGCVYCDFYVCVLIVCVLIVCVLMGVHVCFVDECVCVVNGGCVCAVGFLCVL